MAGGFKIQVSRVVQVSSGRGLASIRTKFGGPRHISTASLNHAGLKVPKCRRYRVTYRVDVNGPIRVVCRQTADGPCYGGLVSKGLSARRMVFVCLIEDRRPGTRYRRTVEVLER